MRRIRPLGTHGPREVQLILRCEPGDPGFYCGAYYDAVRMVWNWPPSADNGRLFGGAGRDESHYVLFTDGLWGSIPRGCADQALAPLGVRVVA